MIEGIIAGVVINVITKLALKLGGQSWHFTKKQIEDIVRQTGTQQILSQKDIDIIVTKVFEIAKSHPEIFVVSAGGIGMPKPSYVKASPKSWPMDDVIRIVYRIFRSYTHLVNRIL